MDGRSKCWTAVAGGCSHGQRVLEVPKKVLTIPV